MSHAGSDDPEKAVNGALIADAYGSEAASSWEKCALRKSDKDKLASVGMKILELIPPRPGSCVLMSAVYALALEKAQAAPAYVVAGSLYAGGVRIFGRDGDFEGKEIFSVNDLSWDGHAWLLSGEYLADLSIFRTAYSKASPPALSSHVLEEFGSGRGLMICRLGDLAKSGLRYEPKYVLTQQQIDALGRGARITFTGSSP